MTEPTPALPPDAAAVYRRYLSAVVLHGLASAAVTDVNATDLYALSLLELAGSMTAGELAARTGLTTGATTRLSDRLERSGHARRTIDPGDRRKVIIQAKEHPAEIDEAVAPARRRVAAILSGYTPEQLAVLFDYFARAGDAYQEATDELRGLGASRRAPVAD